VSSATRHDNPGWTPDIARMLIAEMRKTSEIQRELVLILRDVRDELELARTDRRKRDQRREPRKVAP
jgi:predicted glycosyltransferase